jgi:thymidine kinase
VVINGIDYDFKADPFSHMHHLLLMSRFLPGWRTFQLTTQCYHCPNPARGSRRVITFPDGHKEIADATSPIVMPGLSNYYAVCDVFHKPCTRLGTTETHVRPPLPTTLTLEQIQQIPWMQATLAHFQITI